MNQILTSLLESLSTADLIPVAGVSHRFHCIATRVILRRLLDAASLPHNHLILECYHPSAKLSTPYLSCHYLGTKMQGDQLGLDGAEPCLWDLRRLYSSFRPEVAEENQPFILLQGGAQAQSRTATEEICLDEGELFSQLCAVTNMVKPGPRPGLFLNNVNIGEGVLRIWRDWLADMTGYADPGEAKKSFEHRNFIWADADHNVGVRFRVQPAPTERMPVISGPDDHPPVSYRLEYAGVTPRSTTGA